MSNQADWEDHEAILLRNAVEHSEDIVFITDSDGSIEYVNPSFLRVTGYSKDEVIGKNPRFLKSGKMSEGYYRQLWNTITSGKPIHEVVINKNKDGSEFYYDQTITPVFDSAGIISNYISTGKDITASSLLQKEFEEQQKIFQLFVKYTPAAVAMFDRDLNYLLVSDRWIEDYGLTGMDIIGKNHYDVFPEISQRADWQDFHKRALNGEVIRSSEDSFTRSDGRIDWIRWELHPWYGKDGNIAGIVMFTEVINETKEFQETLSREKELAQLYLDVAGTFFVVIGKDQRIQQINRKGCEILGYGQDELIGRNWFDTILPKERAGDVKTMFNRIIKGEIKPFEYVEDYVFDRKGEKKDIAWHNSVLRDNAGNIIASISSGHDITETMKVACALEESEEMFRTLSESIQDIFLGFDNNLNLLYWNKTAEELTGVSSQAVLGKNIFQVFPGLLNTEIEKQLKEAKSDRTRKHFTTDFTLDNLSELWLDISIFPSGNGLSFLARDITENKKAEIEIFENAQIFDQILESVITTDLGGIIETWNKGAERLFQYQSREIIGKNIRILYPEEEYEYLEQKVIKPLIEKSTHAVEARLRKKNGEQFTGYLVLSLKYNYRHEVVGMIGSTIDISERKRAEEELRDHKDNLELLVSERTKSLQQINEKLKESEKKLLDAKLKAESANRAKSTFLANMSHEIRTPLNTIIGFANLIEKDPRISNELRNRIRIINRSGEHLLELIDDILELSKIEAGRTTLHTSSFNLIQFLKTLHSMFFFRTEAKGLKFSVYFDENIPEFVIGDEKKIRQIFFNLVSNAIKYTDEGEIAIRVWVSDLKNERFFLHAGIHDTGIGIHESDFERIFGYFEQSKMQVQNRSGTGLGLAITKEFVQLMRGEISLQSTVGEGSVFKFKIELQTSLVPPKGLPSADSLEKTVYDVQLSNHGKKLIIVDDDPGNRRLLRAILEPWGFEIREASQGAEALEIFRRWEADLLLIDLAMPLINGFELAGRIRSLLLEEGKQPVLIAVTAGVTEENKRMALQYGFDGFLAKPIREVRLVEAISQFFTVEYTYRNQEIESDSVLQQSQDHLYPLLSTISPELLGTLNKALVEGDLEKLKSITREVEEENEECGSLVNRLVNSFQFENIQKTIQQILNRSRGE